jgi:hypothetical protein
LPSLIVASQPAEPLLSSAFAMAQPMPLEHAGNDSELLVNLM